MPPNLIGLLADILLFFFPFIKIAAFVLLVLLCLSFGQKGQTIWFFGAILRLGFALSLGLSVNQTDRQ